MAIQMFRCRVMSAVRLAARATSKNRSATA